MRYSFYALATSYFHSFRPAENERLCRYAKTSYVRYTSCSQANIYFPSFWPAENTTTVVPRNIDYRHTFTSCDRARVLAMSLFSTAAFDSCIARANIVLLNCSAGLGVHDVTRVNYGIIGLRANCVTLVIPYRFLPGFSRSIQVFFLLSPFSSRPTFV